MMYQKDEIILGIPLQEGEQVYFVEERNVQRGRVIYSAIAILFAFAGLFWLQTVIVPVITMIVIALCVYFRIRPASDVPVGWVLTNMRFIQIHLNEQVHQPLIVDVANLKEVEADRDEKVDSGGSDIIADIVMFPIKLIFNGIRDAILNRHEKATKAYWRNTKRIVLHYQDDSQSIIECHNDYIAQNVGSILVKSLQSIENDAVIYAKERTISR